MTQYLLGIYQPDGPTPAPAALERVMRDVTALIDETKSAGAWVFNGGLFPSHASTVVRVQRGDAVVTDGPYIEAKEHIGGFVIVTAPDLDGALKWARKLARALTLDGADTGLAIEVRPFQH